MPWELAWRMTISPCAMAAPGLAPMVRPWGCIWRLELIVQQMLGHLWLDGVIQLRHLEIHLRDKPFQWFGTIRRLTHLAIPAEIGMMLVQAGLKRPYKISPFLQIGGNRYSLMPKAIVACVTLWSPLILPTTTILATLTCPISFMCGCGNR